LICPKIQVGEDDLPGKNTIFLKKFKSEKRLFFTGFDLISQFSGRYAPPGVSKINGSTQFQVLEANLCLFR